MQTRLLFEQVYSLFRCICVYRVEWNNMLCIDFHVTINNSIARDQQPDKISTFQYYQTYLLRRYFRWLAYCIFDRYGSRRFVFKMRIIPIRAIGICSDTM